MRSSRDGGLCRIRGGGYDAEPEPVVPRTTCASFLDYLARSAPILEGFHGSDRLGAELVDGKFHMRGGETWRRPPVGKPAAPHTEPLTVEDRINFWLQKQIAAIGPKVFRPTLEQCLAMEQVAPRIAISDYSQPYPVMVVDFPEEYQKRRACEYGFLDGVSVNAPACLLIGAYGEPPWTIWLEMVLDGNTSIVWALLPTDPTIEDGIESGHDLYLPENMVPSSFGAQQRQVVTGVMRLGTNAMLLLSDLGCSHLGPTNPSHYRRLEHFATVARKRKSGIVEADRNLRLAPQLYGLPQDIILHAEERTNTDSPASNGEPDAPRRPHWRRGHWKMQACGPNLSQHRRLFIKPVLVNRHLLRQGEGIPQTTYRVRSDAPAAQTNDDRPVDGRQP